MKHVAVVFVTLFCCSAVVYAIESLEQGQSCDTELPTFEMCDQHPDCPRESHPLGETCPHADPSPF